MELIFNDLSEMPLCNNETEAFERVDRFISTFKAAQTAYQDINKIRFHKDYDSVNLLDGFTLRDYCSKNRTKGTLLNGLFKMPFIDDNSEEEKRYIETSFLFRKDTEEINPYGLSAAFLYSRSAIGFLSESFWAGCIFDIIIKTSEKTIEKVYCISKPEHIKEQTLIDFIEANLPIELLESKVDVEKKEIKLRDDHGKDKLEEFSKRIRNSKYVESIINSLPYNPHCRDFIKEVYPDGKIEIVLTGTNKGLGIIIKTTGRNLRETQEIAKILESNYCC